MRLDPTLPRSLKAGQIMSALDRPESAWAPRRQPKRSWNKPPHNALLVAVKGETPVKRERPPLSLTLRWDKVTWHADGEGLPPGVTGLAAGRHVFAALDFLGVVGQLTAEGKREQAGDLGDSTALLRQHVKAGARSFLDATYTNYLEAMTYGEEPPIAILEQAWAEWTQRYDVSKRPLANAYQAE